ncbi:hypothetical protein Agub_g16002, partial [Astrephomene gubernaculifera]
MGANNEGSPTGAGEPVEVDVPHLGELGRETTRGVGAVFDTIRPGEGEQLAFQQIGVTLDLDTSVLAGSAVGLLGDGVFLGVKFCNPGASTRSKRISPSCKLRGYSSGAMPGLREDNPEHAQMLRSPQFINIKLRPGKELDPSSSDPITHARREAGYATDLGASTYIGRLDGGNMYLLVPDMRALPATGNPRSDVFAHIIQVLRYIVVNTLPRGYSSPVAGLDDDFLYTASSWDTVGSRAVVQTSSAHLTKWFNDNLSYSGVRELRLHRYNTIAEVCTRLHELQRQQSIDDFNRWVDAWRTILQKALLEVGVTFDPVTNQTHKTVLDIVACDKMWVYVEYFHEKKPLHQPFAIDMLSEENRVPPSEWMEAAKADAVFWLRRAFRFDRLEGYKSTCVFASFFGAQIIPCQDGKPEVPVSIVSDHDAGEGQTGNCNFSAGTLSASLRSEVYDPARVSPMYRTRMKYRVTSAFSSRVTHYGVQGNYSMGTGFVVRLSNNIIGHIQHVLSNALGAQHEESVRSLCNNWVKPVTMMSEQLRRDVRRVGESLPCMALPINKGFIHFLVYHSYFAHGSTPLLDVDAQNALLRRFQLLVNASGSQAQHLQEDVKERLASLQQKVESGFQANYGGMKRTAEDCAPNPLRFEWGVQGFTEPGGTHSDVGILELVSRAIDEIVNRLLLFDFRYECIFVPSCLWGPYLHSSLMAWFDVAKHIAENPFLAKRDGESLKLLCQWPSTLWWNFRNGERTSLVPVSRLLKELMGVNVIYNPPAIRSRPIVQTLRAEFIEFLVGWGPEWREEASAIKSLLQGLFDNFTVERATWVLEQVLKNDVFPGELLCLSGYACEQLLKPILDASVLEAFAMERSTKVIYLDERSPEPGGFPNSVNVVGISYFRAAVDQGCVREKDIFSKVEDWGLHHGFLKSDVTAIACVTTPKPHLSQAWERFMRDMSFRQLMVLHIAPFWNATRPKGVQPWNVSVRSPMEVAHLIAEETWRLAAKRLRGVGFPLGAPLTFRALALIAMHYRVLMSYGVSEADAKDLWKHAIFYAKNGGMWHKQPAQWDAVPCAGQLQRDMKERMSFLLLTTDLDKGVDPMGCLSGVCERASAESLAYASRFEGKEQAVLG